MSDDPNEYGRPLAVDDGYIDYVVGEEYVGDDLLPANQGFHIVEPEGEQS